MSDSLVIVSKALFFPFILLHHLEATCSSDNAFLTVYDSVFQPGVAASGYAETDRNFLGNSFIAENETDTWITA